MSRLSFKILSVLAAAMLFCVPALADGYTITDYEVEINVSSARVHTVTENIEASFSAPRHGIIRQIPLSSSQEPYVIKNQSVEGAPCSESFGNNVLSLKIGDPNSLVQGERSYRIAYEMHYAADGDSENDIVYVSPIGTEWDCPIFDASVKITLPTDEIKSIKLYTGGYGEARELDGYTADGNIITISGVSLAPYNGLTFYIELPEGTFASAPKSLAPVRGAICIALAVLAAVIAAAVFVQWFGKGRDERIVPTVEFYSPDDMNPAELSYVINRSVGDTEAGAMLFFWAAKGYIRYTETDKSGFELTKLKEMGGERPSYEKAAFDSLFKKSDTVTKKYIENKFYDDANDIKANAAEAFCGARSLVSPSQSKSSVGCFLLCLAVPLLYALLAMTEAAESGAFAFAGLVPPFFVYFIAKKLIQDSVKPPVFGAALSVITVLAGAWLAPQLMEVRLFGTKPLCTVIVLGSSIGALFAALINRRSDYATQITGRSLGFADFLRTAEKDRLEMLVNENPSYFFDTLPFAVALGVTNIWAKKFESLVKEPPSWYVGYGYPFSAARLSRSMNSAVSSMSNVYAARAVKNAASSGGGGFSGGGFSGGGGGGGGGSSW